MILAAGASRRMGSPKALLPWGESSFVQHLCAVLDRQELSNRAVVTRAELAPSLRVDWPLWINPDPERGMLSSLQTAIAYLEGNCPWLLVALVDQPAIDPGTFQVMISQAQDRGWSSPVHQGRPGHPVIIGRDCFASLSAAAPDRSPRDVLSAFPRHLVEVDDPCVTLDFDTPEELQTFRQGRSNSSASSHPAPRRKP